MTSTMTPETGSAVALADGGSGSLVVEFSVPIRTVSEANQRLASMAGVHAKKRRVKEQREVTRCAWLQLGNDRRGPISAYVPGRVLLTRVAPRGLDDDNVRGALKAVRDEVAAILGVDDRDPRVSWEYAQERGARGLYAVHVRITPGIGAVAEWRVMPASYRAHHVAHMRERGWDLEARALEEIAR